MELETQTLFSWLRFVLSGSSPCFSIKYKVPNDWTSDKRGAYALQALRTVQLGKWHLISVLVGTTIGAGLRTRSHEDQKGPTEYFNSFQLLVAQRNKAAQTSPKKTRAKWTPGETFHKFYIMISLTQRHKSQMEPQFFSPRVVWPSEQGPSQYLPGKFLK